MRKSWVGGFHTHAIRSRGGVEEEKMGSVLL